MSDTDFDTDFDRDDELRALLRGADTADRSRQPPGGHHER